jgi:hypothetical protein
MTESLGSQSIKGQFRERAIETDVVLSAHGPRGRKDWSRLCPALEDRGIDIGTNASHWLAASRLRRMMHPVNDLIFDLITRSIFIRSLYKNKYEAQNFELRKDSRLE